MKDTVFKWLVGAGLTAAVGLLGLYMHYEIRSQVESQLAIAGMVKSGTVDLMQKDIDSNADEIEDLKANAEKLDSKIERVVQILLED